MELPHIGEHCSHDNCNQLDFLPIQCDLCKKKFCLEHHKYEAHSCPESYAVDVQVPICPLCSVPIPFKRSEPPDIAVNAHIMNNCKVKKNKIYTNKCMQKGCKTKELVSVKCESCQMNLCLRHRNPIDHECKGPSAARRELTLNGSIFKNLSNSNTQKAKPIDPLKSDLRVVLPPPRVAPFAKLQGNLSEEEALEQALRASSLDGGARGPTPVEQDDAEDLALARAIAASMREETSGRKPKIQESCSLS